LIENVYTLKIINKGGGAVSFRFQLTGARVLSEDRYIAVAAGEFRNAVVRVRVNPAYLKQRSSELTLVVESGDTRLKASEAARFLGPSAK
jgi:hypothetical protein|tara:strand:- start:243 stop:512 length:270 start_codon:yes stop_codon:yes gene_type:complete